MMFRIGLGVWLALATLSIAGGDEPRTAEEKREWLRERLIPRMTDVRAIRDTHARLDRMTPQELDALVQHYQRELAAARQAASAQAGREEPSRSEKPGLHMSAEQLEAYRNQRIAEYSQRLAAARGGNPGFAPVITTLPSGASLGASAVVSPDRRYVRVNAAPFFSQVDGYRLFNMANGAYSPLIPVHPQQGYYPPGYYPGAGGLPAAWPTPLVQPPAATPQYQYRPIRPQHSQPGFKAR